MKYKIFVICFLLLVNSSLANVFDHKAGVEKIEKSFPDIQDISCKFKQERELKNLEKPLVSGGNFRFKKGEGVYFETTYPIKQNYSYTKNNYKEINDIFSSVSSKKYSKLSAKFDFYFEEKNGNKIIGLKPKKGTPASLRLEYITIEGKNGIDKIVIKTKEGEKITQWFQK